MTHTTSLTPPEKAVVKVELAQPIVDGGQKLTTLYFRSPTMGDLVTIEEASIQGTSKGNAMLIAALSGILLEAALRLSVEDSTKIKKELQGFFSPETWEAIQETIGSGIAVSAMLSSAASP